MTPAAPVSGAPFSRMAGRTGIRTARVRQGACTTARLGP